jgi:FKBP-type peptidyl-prolyl cis-trans isomerase (trigger factor)
MQQLIDAIDREARNLPPEAQQEVLDFISQLQRKYQSVSQSAWLEQAWGAAPDFPDRPEQPLLDLPL